jgi:hypothetical protein
VVVVSILAMQFAADSGVLEDLHFNRLATDAADLIDEYATLLGYELKICYWDHHTLTLAVETRHRTSSSQK